VSSIIEGNPLDFFESLNPQQREAVEYGDGPALVVAGPGSGKTRVLTGRFGFLVLRRGVYPSHILAVTFTNKAAREMRDRVERLLAAHASGQDESRFLSVGTFHSLCARWLRRDGQAVGLPPHFVIYDEDDKERLIRQALAEFDLNPKQCSPSAVGSAISRAKNELGPLPDEAAARKPFERAVARIAPRYQEMLTANGAADFDDLLVLTVRMFRECPEILARYQDRYRHILVDEFQDTNEVQYNLVRLLAGARRNLFVVGDADQSIYRWRGADYRNVQRFQKDFPDARTFLLEDNYRSTQHILDAATGVIRRNRQRVEKRLHTNRGEGAQIVLYEAYDEEEEARYVLQTISGFAETGSETPIQPGECAIMYRTNAQSRAMEEAFVHAGMPYRLVGAQRFYGRREIKDALAYLRVILNPADSVSLGRVINVPPRGIGEKGFAALQESASRVGISPGELLLGLAEPDGEGRYGAVFSARALAAFSEFGKRLAGWRQQMLEQNVGALLRLVLRDIRYREFMEDGSEEGEDRWENVRELIAAADESQAASLEEFLEDVALVSDQDTLAAEQDSPILLTLHAAKGLEFRAVFIIGLDEGLLPHSRSLDDDEALAEERRLFYVGITRAKDRLYLLRAFRRSVYGGGAMDPSRFLRDIPAQTLASGGRSHGSASAAWDWSAASSREIEKSVEARYRSGMRVRHPRFGDGLVIESRIRGSEEELTIAFDDVGVKRLDAETAPLTALDEPAR
jgi:DNA helicase II / ATP-dependent DNA helicase PcrA